MWRAEYVFSGVSHMIFVCAFGHNSTCKCHYEWNVLICVFMYFCSIILNIHGIPPLPLQTLICQLCTLRFPHVYKLKARLLPFQNVAVICLKYKQLDGW